MRDLLSCEYWLMFFLVGSLWMLYSAFFLERSLLMIPFCGSWLLFFHSSFCSLPWKLFTHFVDFDSCDSIIQHSFLKNLYSWSHEWDKLSIIVDSFFCILLCNSLIFATSGACYLKCAFVFLGKLCCMLISLGIWG